MFCFKVIYIYTTRREITASIFGRGVQKWAFYIDVLLILTNRVDTLFWTWTVNNTVPYQIAYLVTFNVTMRKRASFWDSKKDTFEIEVHALLSYLNLTAQNWQKWKFLTYPCHKFFQGRSGCSKKFKLNFKNCNFCKHVEFGSI